MNTETDNGHQVRSNDELGVGSDVDMMRDVYMTKAQREAYERIAKNAERYQWLLRNAGYGISRHQHAELYLGGRIVPAPDHISQLSAAIDAAMLLTPNAALRRGTGTDTNCDGV